MEAAAASEKRRLTVRQDVRCRPGCSACCSRYLEVTVAEAMVVVEHLRQAGRLRAVLDAARSQVQAVRQTPQNAWFKLNIPCPVLDPSTRLCSAYPVRPPACSTHHAVSDPSACEPWSSSDQPFMPVDFADVFMESQRRVLGATEADGILRMQLPMPVALLLADRASRVSDLNYEQAVDLISREL